MRTTVATRRLAVLGALGSAAMHVTPAAAQSADPAVAAPTTQPAAEVGEIVVTAQRRSENLQTVPISITAFNAQTLQNRNVRSTDDLMKVTPGLQIGSGSIQRNELTIRGIGSNRFDAGGEASSGLFIDDVYQPRFSNLLVNLLDVERVEVLKGPQGTLYGRNTIGGAIAIYTPVPDQTFRASARLDGGSRDLYAGQVNVSGPLGDTVSLGISGGYYHRDGFMKDTVSGRTNGGENYGGRAKLAWRPTSQLKVVLTGGAFKTKQDALVFDRATPGVFFGNPIVSAAPDGDRYREAYDRPTGATTRIYQASGRADYEGDAVTLTSITAWQHTKEFTIDDQDSTTFDSFGYTQTIDSRAFSQEFRLASAPNGPLSAGGRLKWVAGLYYFHERAIERTDFRLGPDSIAIFLATLNGDATPGSSASNLVGKNISTDSYAAFGQATFAVTDTLNLTVGGRYTRDHKNFLIFGDTTLPGYPLLAADYSVNPRKSWEKFTPKVAVDFTPVHGVMLYGSWSRGFKSGASQSVVFFPGLAQQLVSPETVDTYEAGIKSRFLDNKLQFNIAGYYSKFSNLQVRRFVAAFPGGPVVPFLENAANSKIKGFEIEAVLTPVRGLRFDVGYNYLDARYGTYIPDATSDFSGNRLPRAPKNTLTIAGRYEYELANGGILSAGAQTFFSSRFFFQPDNSAILSQGHYSTTDVNLGYAFPGKHIELTAWGRNVFGKQYLVYAENLSPPVRRVWSDRATFGVTLKIRR